jgi:hypothetical protein
LSVFHMALKMRPTSSYTKQNLHIQTHFHFTQVLNEDLGIGARHLTISTVGVPNAMEKLAAHKLQASSTAAQQVQHRFDRCNIMGTNRRQGVTPPNMPFTNLKCT